MATDHEEIERLRNEYDQLLSDVKNLRREVANHARLIGELRTIVDEVGDAVRFLWDIVKRIDPDHPEPGPAVSVRLEAEPIIERNHP